MDVMWAALIAVVLVVTVVAAVSVLRRPRGSDLNSVRQYHSALGTIEHISARSGQSSVRVVGPTGGTGDDASPAGVVDGEGGHPADGSGSMPAGTPGEGDGSPGRGGPVVFDDARPHDRFRYEHAARGAPMSRTDRAQRHALHSMNRRPRRGTAVMVAVVALALFVALAFVGSRRSTSANHPRGVTSSTVTDHTTARSTTTTSTAAGASHRKGHAHGKAVTPRPTPTTIPTAIVASSSTAVSAVYPVDDNSYRVVVSVAAPCWVLATSVSSGATLWTGTLPTGASQVIQATGTIKVELGALSATLTVDNVPVTLPTPVHSPFVATFQPSVTPTPGATTTLAPTSPSTTIPIG
jgi:hypothetical protein